MSEVISNFQIEQAFKNLNDPDTNDNFVGAFPANQMNIFIDYKSMKSEKKGKYPFWIANTNSSDKNSTHCWSILDSEPKTDIFLFDSFGVDGLKNFIIQDDKNVIEKIRFGTEQLTRTDNKVALVNIKFNLNACKNLSKKELDNLSDTARDFFYFVQSFGNKLKLSDFLNIWMVEDRVQNLNSVTCGIFEIYFYDNLFNPNQASKIQNKKRLNKKTIEILLNEQFVLDNQQQNEAAIDRYVNEHAISVTRPTCR